MANACFVASISSMQALVDRSTSIYWPGSMFKLQCSHDERKTGTNYQPLHS